ncbi:MAG TPA: heme NO-binding protein [Planctomycetes bacterium]|nr:heme NO-binding protein [Planctomycetota bacterium]
MYGLVNQAVQGMVIAGFGEDAWERIKSEAGIDLEAFVSMESYDDAITYSLVQAGSTILGLSPEAILRAFGEYWVLETAAEGYPELMRAGGNTLPEFIGNLDQLHSRVLMTFPELCPPSFNCKEVDPGELRVAYMSERVGLEFMVIGLLEGLGKHFKTPVEVSMIEAARGPGTPAEFLVRYGMAASPA